MLPVLAYLIVVDLLLIAVACYAAWLRDRFAEIVFGGTAGAVLVFALAGVGLGHNVAPLVRAVIYCSLGVVMLLIGDALVFNRHKNV
jgi:hypothetical protein